MSVQSSATEAYKFFLIARGKGAFGAPESATVSGVQCRIYADAGDNADTVKRHGIDHALRRLMGKKKFSWPTGISFYCTANAMTEAWHRGPDGVTEECNIVLGKSISGQAPKAGESFETAPGSGAMPPGIAHKVAPAGGVDFAAAVIIHELGHNLHARNNPDAVYAGRALDTNYSIADVKSEVTAQISLYGIGNALEFVAETFTALVYGYAVSPSLQAKYKALGGPEV